MTSIAVEKIGQYGGEDLSWRPSNHGEDMTPSITLDVSKFTEATHYPDGFIPSGVVVGKVTASGLYGPYDAEATDGTEAPVGHLFASLSVKGRAKLGGAVYVHGLVDESRLPSGHGLDAAAKTALSQITYI